MLALAEASAVSQYSGFGAGSSMPLSSQDIFPVVSSFKQLTLSPTHEHPLQPEDMVTDKEQVEQPEVGRTLYQHLSCTNHVQRTLQYNYAMKVIDEAQFCSVRVCHIIYSYPVLDQSCDEHSFDTHSGIPCTQVCE